MWRILISELISAPSYRLEERIMGEEPKFVNQQTVTYTFIANYLVWAALFLVAWMSFMPILSIRRAPAIALNKLSR